MRTVAAVFPNEAEAEKTARDLKALGVPSDDILVAGGEEHPLKTVVSARRNMSAGAASGAGWLFAGIIPQVINQRSPEAGAGVGALVGIVFGAVGGFIAHVPVNSPFHSFHMLAVVVAGMLIGAAAGGLVAWMYSLGVSREAIALCAEADREHGVVVSAHVPEDTEQAAVCTMNAHHATKVHADANAWLASDWKGPHAFEYDYPSDSSIKEVDAPEETSVES